VRLFLAVAPPPAAVRDLDAALDAVRRSHPDLRWTPPERWHLTLAFFGEVLDGDLPRLRRRVGAAVRGSNALALAFAGAGRFDGRVLWAGVVGDVAALRRLAGRVAPDERAYHPHLTVARTRAPTDLRAPVQALAAYAGPPWTARSVDLVRSRLGPEPRYDTVDRWPLGED
jgi:2'-5' RNA ligase